jgi:hypothetical protein
MPGKIRAADSANLAFFTNVMQVILTFADTDIFAHYE